MQENAWLPQQPFPQLMGLPIFLGSIPCASDANHQKLESSSRSISVGHPDISVATLPHGVLPFQPILLNNVTPLPLDPPDVPCPSFTETNQHYQVLSYDKKISYTTRIDSKFHKGFFLDNDDWTCYRRNYFQISSAFSLTEPNHLANNPACPCLVERDGVFHKVVQFHMGVLARDSKSDEPVELLQLTPKRDKGPQITPVTKPVKIGGNIKRSLLRPNQSIGIFERIQFKNATAKNGKKRSNQQRYILIVELIAECASGRRIQVATTRSSPLVVRGRSPGHYADSQKSSTFEISTIISDNSHDQLFPSQNLPFPTQSLVIPFGAQLPPFNSESLNQTNFLHPTPMKLVRETPTPDMSSSEMGSSADS